MASAPGNNEKRHPIQVVARRAGLTPDVLRAWENRYGVVEPARSNGGRRLYSDADVERLRLLQTAIAGGRRIGELASLPPEQLQSLVDEDRRAQQVRPNGPTTTAPPGAARFADEALSAVRALDAPALRAILSRALLALPAPVFLEHLVAPLLNRIGALWAQGLLQPSHEHLATGVIRAALGDILGRLEPRPNAPGLTVATPTGQRHELGAMLAASAAALEGWHVTYLGADLPADDIAEAAVKTGARAVALSLSFDADDDMIAQELRALRRALPADVGIMVGGRAAPAYRDTIRAIGGAQLGDLASLRAVLTVLDSTTSTTSGES